MNSRSDDAIARAIAERDAILAECHHLKRAHFPTTPIPQVTGGCQNTPADSS